MRDVLGGKGAGLAEMTRLGLPVPPGFTITTKACNAFARTGRFPPGLWKQVESALSTVEAKIGRRFGDPSNPLLVSVRSGAKFSMPGMMDTVLNLGLNDETVETLGRISNERFAWDSYRRLIAMFGRIVKDVDGRKFEALLERRKEASHATKDTELSSDDLKALVAEFKELYQAEVGEPFPQNGREQLQQAIAAVFRSWNGKRAVDYRNFNKIPHDLGTAANVQTMVFGNMGPDSGTGVAFTRNPSTGEKQLYGEFLSNAQGEGGSHHEAGGHPPRRAGARDPAPPAPVRRAREGWGAEGRPILGSGPQRLSRGRRGVRVVRPGRSREDGTRREETGRARPGGDISRRRPRDLALERRPDRSRGRDEPCRGRDPGPRDSLRHRLRIDRRRLRRG